MNEPPIRCWFFDIIFYQGKYCQNSIFQVSAGGSIPNFDLAGYMPLWYDLQQRFGPKSKNCPTLVWSWYMGVCKNEIPGGNWYLSENSCKLCTSLNLVIRAISDNHMVMKRTSLIGCVLKFGLSNFIFIIC